MVAPARAAAMPDSAICSGVTGTCSLRPTVSPAPVRAQVIMTLRFIVCFTGGASCSVVLGPWGPGHLQPARGLCDRGQSEIAEVAVLPILEDVVVGPLRRLHDDH